MSIPRESNSAKLDLFPPVLVSMSVDRGTPGTRVVLTTTNCGGFRDLNTVTIGTMFANIESWANTQVVILIPEGARSGDIYLTNMNGDSNGLYFTVPEYVAPKQKITHFYPTEVYPGSEVNIFGKNFGTEMGMAFANDATTLPIKYWSDDKITVIIPAGSDTGNISVHGPDWVVRGEILTVKEIAETTTSQSLKPHVVTINPEAPVVGEVVELTGTNLVETDIEIVIGGTTQEIIYVDKSCTRVQFRITDGTAAGDLVLTNVYGSSDPLPLMVLGGEPVITFINPIEARIGDSITIFGRNFGSEGLPGVSGVVFGPGPHGRLDFNEVEVWSDTYISLTLPAKLDYTAEAVKVQAYKHVSEAYAYRVYGRSMAPTAYKSEGDIMSLSLGQFHTEAGLNEALLDIPDNSETIANLNTQLVDGKSLQDVLDYVQFLLDGGNDSSIRVANVSKDGLGNITIKGRNGIEVIADTANHTILFYKNSKELLYLDPSKITSFCDLYGNCRLSKISTVPKNQIKTINTGPGIKIQYFKRDGSIFVNGMNLEDRIAIISIDWDYVAHGNHSHIKVLPANTFAHEPGDANFLTGQDMDSEVFNM